ncbi:MAG: hypothetical protein DME19_08050 [Verrucomicrobia bacterium]|nr:MAG: hypothetical protein DME19_08050 [Verrucomicrobiota bacterium]
MGYDPGAVLTVLIGLIFISAGFNTEAQEDPQRFSRVSDWTAKVTWKAIDQGKFTASEDCNVDWRLNQTASAQLKLQGGVNGLGEAFWSGVTNFNAGEVQVDDHAVFSCPSDPNDVPVVNNTINIDLTRPNDATLLLRMDTNASIYQIDFGGFFNAELTETFNGFTITNWTPLSLRDAKWNGTNAVLWLTNRFPLPARGLVLSGSVSLPLADYPESWCPGIPVAGCGVYGQPSGNILFTWELIGEQLEVVVEPSGYTDSSAYEDWMPEGNLKDPNEPARPLLVKATLQTVAGGVPETKADGFTFELLNVSREPGVCMNWPNKELADTNLDLRFDPSLNQPPFVAKPLVWIDETMVETSETSGLTKAEAIVASYDFGGYGKLKVTAQVGGVPIVGYLKTDPAKTPQPILLPKRAKTSHIADKWKKDNDVSSLPDDDDEENDPEGDGHTGDGLTLYEEYRGFAENGGHLQTDAKTKDLFVLDTIQTHNTLAGILNLAWQSGLKVHYQLTTNEIDTTDRLIDFNGSGGGTQHGLIIVLASLGTNNVSGHAEPAPGYEGANSTPGSKARIAISSNIDYFDPGYSLSDREPIDLMTRSSTTVSHELAHGCSVWHHGDRDNIHGVLWTVVNNPDGSRRVFEAGMAITVLNENGSPHAITVSTTNYVGLEHGQHSGVESCFMRYYVAHAYESIDNSSVRYWVDKEIRGYDLCTSRLGTGVNDRTRDKPQPRYGDAYISPDGKIQRGNCRGQICVNDFYLDSPLHER